MASENKKTGLDESKVDKNPRNLFEKWYSEAHGLLGEDASAMALITASGNQPNARIVYLRGKDKKGFWFFTNYNSNKAKELKKNKNACLLFFWPGMIRQVKIKGHVEKLSEKESDNYFKSRQRESQIGAWVSPQSEKIQNRETLDAWVEEYTNMFEGKKVPRPKHWGGFRFIPEYFEFWHGRAHRLHDRIVYSKQKSGKFSKSNPSSGGWKIERLAP